ncbi:hypothetical protein B0H19DRAFT_1308385 [Mycena capillaripes]|nr:hypothetical protein B0H19DRAFT_1308385 [Mycena capillaripes]
MDGNPAPPQPVRKHVRLRPLIIPSIPGLSSTSSSNSPVTPSPSSASTQVQLRAPRRTKWKKMDDFLTSYGFENLGDFLAILFHPRVRGEPNPRTRRHRAAVSAFLQGCSNTKMADLIELLYNHPQSRPKKKYPDQCAAALSPHKPLGEILFARPCLSSWATQVVGNRAHFRVGKLGRKPKEGRSRRHLRATTNGRNPNAQVVEREDTDFTIQGLAEQYAKEDEFLWYLTECFAAPRKNGKVVVRKCRPHTVIQVGASSSFILSRNTYASGDLALPLGIWLFATKSHIDVKRVYSRFGSTVSDSTACKALASMSDASLAKLREEIRDATARGETEYGKIVDNVQQYATVYEHGLGRENQLKVGTACTAFKFDDCKPGAFNADDHISRVIKQERQTMTTESVYRSIDWQHIEDVTELHFLRVLADYDPHLNHMSTEISARFRTVHAKHRLHPHRKVLQPLPTNAEREVENKGMFNGLLDFEKAMGIEPDKCDNLLSWLRGDGASHATAMRLKRLLAVCPNIYNSLRNLISTPETWHTKSTDLNSCASNHYGRAASKDPSSLSRSSNAANMKRPTDLKKCDFYPTSRSMTMIWEARVLDCWRLVLGCKSDLLSHFEELAANDSLPSLDELLKSARIIRERYASQTAYEQSLDKSEQDEAHTRIKVPVGSPWMSTQLPAADDGDKEDGPKVHKEPPGFDGDRVLSNAILFLMEFGWWTELDYAISEGDVGRVMKILKIFIFTFGGTSNRNYMSHMLDLYALLQFECSPDLKEALLNNYLMTLQGDAGTFIEGDLMQEWNNRWLEDTVQRRGGDFDDKFYRKIIAPNVLHFLKIKADIETAFELKRRGKAHTSPHLRDETKVLLKLYEEEELHLFRSGRSLGHAAVNRFDRGYQRLEDGKMDEYLQRSAEYAELLCDMEKIRSGEQEPRTHHGDENSVAMDVDRAIVVPSPDSSAKSDGSHDSASAARASRPPSASSIRSSVSSASRLAADCVEQWDNLDHSEEHLVSGSDLAVTVDPDTGRMSSDWYGEEEFEEALERIVGPEEAGEEDEESEDEEPESESEGEE